MDVQGIRIGEMWNELQVTVAVVLGIILQTLLGEKKGYMLVVTVATSSIFVALFIVPAAIEILDIDRNGKLAVAMYALSALVSVEILAVMLKVLPKAVAIKAKKYLGVSDDTPQV